MNINLTPLLDFVKVHNSIFVFLAAFFLGILVSYLFSVGKRKKDVIDKKKLESYVRGMNYIIEDNMDKAIEELSNTVKLDPDLVDIYNSIGNLFRKRGEINRALILHQSLLVRPNLDKKKKLELYINVGVDYRKAGLYDRAKEYFKNALSIDPKNSLARKYLEEVYEDSKDWESALEWHKRFGESDSIIAHIYAEIGKDRLSDNSTEDARKNFEKAIKKDKGNVSANVYLADIYFLKGNKKKAYDILENIARLQPTFANLALERIKEKDVLKRVVKGLLIDFKDNEYILYHSANALYNIGEHKKAFSLYMCLMKKGVKTSAMISRFVEKQEGLPDFVKYYARLSNTKDVKYTCTSCGYSSYTLFFRCPKCRTWDNVKVDLV